MNKLDSTNNKSKCCLPDCTHNSNSLSYYPFPDKEKDFLSYRCWLREIRKHVSQIGCTFQLAENPIVCERHFRDEDFVIINGLKLLREGSLPIVFDGNDHSSDDNDNEVEFMKEIKVGNVGGNIEKSLEDLENELKQKETKLKNQQSKEKKLEQEFTMKERLTLERKLHQQKLEILLDQQERYKNKATHSQKQKIGERFPVTIEEQQKQIQEQLRNLEKEQEELRQARETHKKLKEPKTHERNNTVQKPTWQKQKETLEQMMKHEKEKLHEIQQQEILSKPPKVAKKDQLNSRQVDSEFTSCKKCNVLKGEVYDLRGKLKMLESENEMLKLKISKYSLSDV